MTLLHLAEPSNFPAAADAGQCITALRLSVARILLFESLGWL
jgi:hypothetical protein